MEMLSLVLAPALACVVGGIVPWINIELVILGAAALVPSAALLPLVTACTLGNMSAKSVLYAVTRWAPDRLPRRARAALERTHRYRGRRRLLAAAAFFGSAVSIPPFYLVTLASGLLRVPFVVFVLAGLSGTAARYGALVWAARALGFGGP